MKHVIAGICLLVPCFVLPAAGGASDGAVVGCYEADGSRLLVTWHPTGGIHGSGDSDRIGAAYLRTADSGRPHVLILVRPSLPAVAEIRRKVVREP